MLLKWVRSQTNYLIVMRDHGCIYFFPKLPTCHGSDQERRNDEKYMSQINISIYTFQ